MALLLVVAGVLALAVGGLLQSNPSASFTPTPTKTPAPKVALVVTLPAEMSDDPTRLPESPPPATAAPETTPTRSGTGLTLPTRSPTPTRLPPTPTPSPTPAWTAVPLATFTPPAGSAALVAPQEHYWFQRPIPPEYANWTDRNYPYGSTMGRTLPTHHGVELINPVGVPVLAAGNGVVAVVGTDAETVYGPQPSFYGNLVIIQHSDLYQGQPVYTVYGHLSQVLVTAGQPVAAGDQIGAVGGTGVANGGAHLHFEVRVGENRYQMTRNPELWLRPFPGWGTIAGQLLWPDGSYVYEAPLLIRRADDPSLFVNRTVYTYADDSVNPDDLLRENFTTPDLQPGPYEIVFNQGDVVRREVVWVYPNQTSFITIQLSSP